MKIIEILDGNNNVIGSAKTTQACIEYLERTKGFKFRVIA